MKLDKETNTLTLEDGSVYKVELIKKSTKRWKPKNGDDYYLPRIKEDESMVSYIWQSAYVDSLLYSLGEVFQTEEEARKEYNYRVMRQRVKDAIAELNDGFFIGGKSYFEFNRAMICFESSLRGCFGESWKLLKSSDAANKLRNMFTEDELKLALFEIHE